MGVRAEGGRLGPRAAEVDVEPQGSAVGRELRLGEVRDLDRLARVPVGHGALDDRDQRGQLVDGECAVRLEQQAVRGQQATVAAGAVEE